MHVNQVSHDNNQHMARGEVLGVKWAKRPIEKCQFLGKNANISHQLFLIRVQFQMALQKQQNVQCTHTVVSNDPL